MQCAVLVQEVEWSSYGTLRETFPLTCMSWMRFYIGRSTMWMYCPSHQCLRLPELDGLAKWSDL